MLMVSEAVLMVEIGSNGNSAFMLNLAVNLKLHYKNKDFFKKREGFSK